MYKVMAFYHLQENLEINMVRIADNINSVGKSKNKEKKRKMEQVK